MSEHDECEDGLIDRVAEVLRAAEPAAPDFTVRLMAAVSAEALSTTAQQGPRRVARGWWRRRRTVQLSLSPLGALALAAGLAGFAVFADITMRASNAPVLRTAFGGTAASAPHKASTPPDTVHLVRFVFMAPQASSVAMVGDFNNWDRAVTPLRRTGSGGTWTVSVPLPPGPHQYAFVVDGTSWTPDPASTTTVRDDFGTLTSVISIGGAS
jgi:hypothetical protein